MPQKSTNAFARWYREPMSELEAAALTGNRLALSMLMERPQRLRCRYLTASLDEVTRWMPGGLSDEGYQDELRRLIEAGTLYRVAIEYSIRRPPKGPKAIAVCRAIEVLPARDGGEINVAVSIPHARLLRRSVWDLLQVVVAEPGRRFGLGRLRRLRRVRDAYVAASPGTRSSAVAQALDLPNDALGLNAARQYIHECRMAGMLPPDPRRGRAGKERA